MRLRWNACALAAVGILALAVPVQAQGLNDVLSRILGNSCGDLQGPYGPNLTQICGATPVGGSSSAGGTAGSEVRSGGEEQRKAYGRTRQRQGGGSADGAGGLSLFGSVDYQKFDKDTSRLESGYDRDTVGTTVGADYLFRNGLVLGGAFIYAHEFGNYDGVGGGFDHDSYGVLVYGSVAPLANMFVDGVAGYTRKDYGFDRRASIFLPVSGVSVASSTSGDTDGDEFKVGVNAGYDFLFGRFTVGPRLGVLYRETTIDGFRESGTTGLELVYDNQNIQSLTTTVGVFGSAALSTGFGVIVPQATAEYVHEFLDDARSVGFSLAQDLSRTKFRFQTEAPDRNYFNLGVGVSMVLRQGWQPFLNFRELLGYRDRNSHSVSVGLRVPF